MEIITTIVVYKFNHLSREEVEAMLGLKLEESRIYQDLERQTRAKVIPKLMAKGMSIEEIAEIVELSVEEVREAARPPQS